MKFLEGGKSAILSVTSVTPVTAVADGAVEEATGNERRRVHNGRERWHTGLGLTSDALADIARARNGA